MHIYIIADKVNNLISGASVFIDYDIYIRLSLKTIIYKTSINISDEPFYMTFLRE